MLLSALLLQWEWRSPSTTQNQAITNDILRSGGEKKKKPLLHISQNCSQRNSNILPSSWNLEKVSGPIIVIKNNYCHIAWRQTFIRNCQIMFCVFDVPLPSFMSDWSPLSPGFFCFCDRWTATVLYALLPQASGKRNKKSFEAFHSFTHPAAAWVDYPRKWLMVLSVFIYYSKPQDLTAAFVSELMWFYFFRGEERGCFNHTAMNWASFSNKTAHETSFTEATVKP